MCIIHVQREIKYLGLYFTSESVANYKEIWLLQIFSRFQGMGVLTKPLSLVTCTDRRSGTKLLQYLAPVRTAAHFTKALHREAARWVR